MYIHAIIFIATSFVEFIRFLFSLPEVKENRLAFLSNRICQDPFENYFGCQRQSGGTSDNPTVSEYFSNTEALRVINSFCHNQVNRNCRGVKSTEEVDENDIIPIPKRQALQRQKINNS